MQCRLLDSKPDHSCSWSPTCDPKSFLLTGRLATGRGCDHFDRQAGQCRLGQGHEGIIRPLQPGSLLPTPLQNSLCILPRGSQTLPGPPVTSPPRSSTPLALPFSLGALTKLGSRVRP